MTDPADRTAAVEARGQVDSLTSIHPSLIDTAELLAARGDLRLVGELCDWVLRDDRVRGALEERVDALLGLPLRFDGRSRPVSALDAKSEWWRMVPETSVRPFVLEALLCGVGVARLVWRDEGGRELPYLQPLPVRWLRQYLSEDGRWAWGKRGAETVVTPGDGTWVLWCPFGTVHPWRWGLWRTLVRWGLLKSQSQAGWGLYAERHGTGILHATGVPAQHQSAVVDKLGKLGRNGRFATSPGVELRLVESTSDTWQTFQGIVGAADNAGNNTLLGPAITTQVASGTYTRAPVRARTRADAESLSTVLHDQLLVPWAIANYGDADKAPWPVWHVDVGLLTLDELREVYGLPPRPLVEQADRAMKLRQAGARVDLEALAGDLGLPLDSSPDADQALRLANAAKTAGANVDAEAVARSVGVPIAPEAPKSGTVYKYHLDYQVLTINELRATLGLPPQEDGDRPPTPAVAPTGEPE